MKFYNLRKYDLIRDEMTISRFFTNIDSAKKYAENDFGEKIEFSKYTLSSGPLDDFEYLIVECEFEEY